MRCARILILLAAFTLSACYVRYPSVGVTGPSYRAPAPTDWRGRRLINCCQIVYDVTTNQKRFYCDMRTHRQCQKLHRARRR